MGYKDKTKEQLIDELKEANKRIAKLEKLEVEHKKAEESLKGEKELEDIIQGSPIPTFFMDKDHKIIYWNKAVEEYYRFKAKESVRAKDHWKSLYSEKRPTVADLLVGEDIEDIPKWNFGRYRKSQFVDEAYGTTDFFPRMRKWLYFTAATIRESKGNITGVLGALKYITGHKRAEEALKHFGVSQSKIVKALRPSVWGIENQRFSKALSESEAKYRELVENANSIIIKIDKKGCLTFFNEFAEKFFGFRKEEIIGKNIIGTIVPETESSGRDLQELINAIIKDPEAHINNENENITRDGKRVWVAWTNKCIYDNKGDVVGVLSVGTDISECRHAEEELQRARDNLELQVRERTKELSKSNEALRKEIEERIRVEKALRESSARMHALIDNLPIEFFAMDTDFRYTMQNFTSLKNYGNVIGKRIMDLEIPTKIKAKWIEQNIQVLKGKIIHEEYEKEVDGEKRTYENLVAPVIVDEAIVGIIGVAIDITDRKQAEEEKIGEHQRFTDMIEFLPDATFVIDQDRKVIAWNRAIEKMTGVLKEEILGKGDYAYSIPFYGFRRPILIDLILLPDEEVESLYDNVERKGDTLYADVFLPDAFGGKGAFLWGKASPLYDDKGNVVGVIESIRDVTERKSAEKKLKKLVEELKRSNEELKRFAYVVSHDLQEPLRTVASFTQLLTRRYEGKLDKNADEYMEFIVEGAKRMQQMIHDLLGYSKVTTRGKDFKVTDTEEILENTLSNLHAAIEENNVIITHDHLPEIMADSSQILQLFQNLVGNAIKFRKPEIPPKIHISAREDKENKKYVFSVQDNGIGMKSQHVERIFGIFQRLHTEKYKGTGIGLAICKKIVERHEGRIWVESQLGKGSTFYFSLHN